MKFQRRFAMGIQELPSPQIGVSLWLHLPFYPGVDIQLGGHRFWMGFMLSAHISEDDAKVQAEIMAVLEKAAKIAESEKNET